MGRLSLQGAAIQCGREAAFYAYAYPEPLGQRARKL